MSAANCASARSATARASSIGRRPGRRRHAVTRARPPFAAHGRRVPPPPARRRPAGNPQPPAQFRYVVRLPDRRIREPGDRNRARQISDTGLNVGSTVRNYRMTDWSWFIADDWRVSSDLTLNLGVRHDYLRVSIREERVPGPLRLSCGARDRQLQDGFVFASNFDPNSVPGAAGLDLNNSSRQSIVQADYNNLMPRVSLAWPPLADRDVVVPRRVRAVLRADDRSVCELAAAGSAVLPRAAAERRRQLEHDPERRADVSGADMSVGFDDGEPILVGDNDPDTEFEAFETQMVSTESRDAVHASVEPHDAVGVPAELAGRGRATSAARAASCCSGRT